MNFRQISLRNRQTFVRLCLTLFPKYRSIKWGSNDTIILWKKNSFFNSRIIVKFTDMIFTHIPLQLSYNKWNSDDLYYNEYFHTIEKILGSFLLDYNFGLRNNISDIELISYNNWLQNELNSTNIMDISNAYLPLYKIRINEYSEMEINKNLLKVTKINIKEDLLDPTLSRIHSIYNDFSLKKTMINLATSVIISLGLYLGIWFSKDMKNQLFYNKINVDAKTFTSTITYNPIHYNKKLIYFGIVQRLKLSPILYHDSS